MSATENTLLHLTVDIWHPSCWTLETTRKADAGLYTHSNTPVGDKTVGIVTLYGPSQDSLKTFGAIIQDSPLTESVTVLSHNSPTLSSPQGSTTQTALVNFDSGPSIRHAFSSRGFVHYGPTRHEDGREQRSLLIRANRQTARRRIEHIEHEYGADIDLMKLNSITDDVDTHNQSGLEHATLPGDQLSPRQRDAFLLARSCGYYGYPREVTAAELAAELDVTKTTFLEHLRKAEAKLLSNIELR